jgi:Ca2+-binding RTX toxin-like protein
MATLDFSKAKQGADMGSPQLSGQPSFVAFGQAGSVLTDKNWNWTTPGGGHRVDLDGSGLTYDSFTGKATGGTINTIRIDLGNNDLLSPDIVITGLNANAPPLAEESEDFWNILAGDDTITGGTRASAGDAFFRIAGDGLHAAPGIGKGGNDLININDVRTYAFGDVFEANSERSGRIAYTGGNDTITGMATGLMQSITGDVWDAHGDVRIYGGNDTLVLRSTSGGSDIVGDVTNMQGSFAGRAIVVGGNDTLLAGEAVTGRMVGDVMNQNYYSILRGGNDYIAGSDMAQTMVGDVYNSEDTAIGGADTIYGYGGNDVISGDAYGAVRGLTGGNDEIYGGAGNDSIYGEYVKVGTGAIVGGNDKLYGEDGNDTIWGQTGNDFLDGGNGDDSLDGETGNDVLIGGSGNDSLRGGDGNDTLDGGSDNDRMTGGIGNDVYVVDSYFDTVTENAGEGIDTVKTTLNALAIGAEIENLTFVGTGNFEGRGNNLSNIITGGNGDDTFTMDGSGNDTFIGLGGTDTIDFRALGGAIVNLATNANGGSASGDRFSSIERIFGSDTGGDILTASNVRAIFFGYGGNDTLNGGSGIDSLYGGEGNDRISGGAGNDVFIGGEDGNDVLAGGLGNDYLDGSAGNDRIQGDEGNDTMRGGDGIDVMLGGEGNDELYGDAGTDLLIGGMGRDTMTGGMDGDRFDFNAVAESGPGAARDIIMDFTVDPAAGAAYIDRVDVSTIDAMMGAAGNQAFTFVGSGPFTGEGQIRAIQVGDNTLLQFNVGGGSGAEMEILLTNVQANTLSAADFIF